MFFSFTTHTHRGMGQRRLQTEKTTISQNFSPKNKKKERNKRKHFCLCHKNLVSFFSFLYCVCVCVCLFGLCGWGYTSSISESTQENKDAWTSQKVLDNFFPGYTFYFLFFKGCCCCCRYDDTFLCCCASRFTNISSAGWPIHHQFSKWFSSFWHMDVSSIFSFPPKKNNSYSGS